MLAAALPIACIASAGTAIREAAAEGTAIREAESDLGAKLHAREMTFEVTVSNQAVDPRIADAVNAAIEQTVIERGRMPSERLEPLAYAVALQTGITPTFRGLCGGRYGGSCCSLLCRVMETNAKGVMIEARDDLDREFRVHVFDGEYHGDPTRRCAEGPLPQRLQCLRDLVTAETSHVKVGPFLVSGHITSALAKAFNVQAQIAEVQPAAEEEASREKLRRERLCNAKVDEAGSAFFVWIGDIARVREVWENAKSSCENLWSPAHQQRMDKMVWESAHQAEVAAVARAERNSREVGLREGGRAQSVPPGTDPKLDVLSFQAGCDRNDLLACIRLGEIFETGGEGVPKDEKRAFRLFKKACDGGSVPGCGCLGRMFLNGTGVPVDKARAAGIWEKACDGGDLVSCTSLGVIIASGADGVPKDEARARALYGRACSAGEAFGCSNLGYVFSKGLGVAADASAAAEYFEKACAGNLAEACRNAVIMHLQAGHRSDLYPFRHLLRRACELGSQTDCDDLRRYYQGEAERLGRPRQPRHHPRQDNEKKALRDRLLGP
jgi:TPR repeat protein